MFIPTTPERSAVSGNLSCDGTGICTVTGPGALTLGVDYPATYGKFYHRHTQETVLGLVCRGHHIPLRETIDGFSFYFGGVPFGACDGMNCLPGPAYQLDIPAQSINFNVTAFQPNSAPSAPTIVGTGGNIGESLSFSATATDADGDQVHYLFDWNNDGVGDVWSPVWSNLVDSGTASTSSYTWWSSGSQTFQVEAYDSYGNASGWSTHTITIVANVTGQCGVSNNVSFSAAPGSGLCLSGTETAVLGSGPWSWSCTGSGAGTTADCQAFVIPTVSLMANPLVVDYGSPTTLTWSTSHTASCSASATGASWSGDQALNNGVGEAVIPNASPATYTLSCSNAEGATASASVIITMHNKLKICEDSCNSTLDRTGQTFGVEQGANKNLKACFNPYPGCAQALGDVTGTAAWADTNVPDDAFSFTGSGEVHPLPFNRTENFTVTYGGVTKAATAQVICIPNACSIDAAKAVTNTYCPDIAQDTRVPSGCDGETLICPGTRHCDYNVREVAP